MKYYSKLLSNHSRRNLFVLILGVIIFFPSPSFGQKEEKPKYSPRKEKHRNKTDELGRKQGLWKHYNYLGILAWEIEYADDMRNGVSKRYYYNGRLMRETEYSYGIKDGFFKRYDYDGNVRAEGEYLNGKKANRWANYYSSGQIRNEGFYKAGFKEGTWKYYNRKGQLINSIVFKNGIDEQVILAREKKAADKAAKASKLNSVSIKK
jgi:antitoxin component YwqK of YwqJK toxin-antitoxin module